MPITADFHLHSSFSGDSDAPMERQIQRGIDLGLSQMCFTEHNDFDFPPTPQEPEGFFLTDTEGYRREFLRCRAKYEGKIKLLWGIELGLQPQLAEKNREYVRKYGFDFVIGSSHLCHGRDPYYPDFFQDRSEEEAYGEYFLSILENIRCFSEFDVYGHLDYVVRYGPGRDGNYSYEKYGDIFDQILTCLVDAGKGIEVNTGGLAAGLKEPHPCSAVLRRYRELGGEILTVGSDAHEPGQVAREFQRAEQILQDCGFRYYTVFEQRKPKFLKL